LIIYGTFVGDKNGRKQGWIRLFDGFDTRRGKEYDSKQKRLKE